MPSEGLLCTCSVFQVMWTEILLIEGANPNGLLALHWHRLHRQVKVIELLLKYGADVNDTNIGGKSILHECVESGRINMVELLLKAGGDPESEDVHGYTPFILALFKENFEMVKVFAKYSKLNPESPTLHIFLHEFPMNAMAPQYLKLFLDSAMDKNAISLSKLSSKYQCLELLIKAGCDVNNKNEQGETILNLMLKGGHHYVPYGTFVPREEVPTRESLCQMLIEAGADVDLPNDSG